MRWGEAMIAEFRDDPAALTVVGHGLESRSDVQQVTNIAIPLHSGGA